MELLISCNVAREYSLRINLVYVFCHLSSTAAAMRALFRLQTRGDEKTTMGAKGDLLSLFTLF